jgi:hypothetical protein
VRCNNNNRRDKLEKINVGKYGNIDVFRISLCRPLCVGRPVKRTKHIHSSNSITLEGHKTYILKPAPPLSWGHLPFASYNVLRCCILFYGFEPTNVHVEILRVPVPISVRKQTTHRISIATLRRALNPCSRREHSSRWLISLLDQTRIVSG